jgi:FtsH-binding integral membrane protein
MPRRPLIERYDGILLGIVAAGLLGLVLSQGADLRRFTNAFGVAVFGLLLWRLISTWLRLTVLEHALSLLLAGSLLAAAIAQHALIARADGTLPDNPWLWVVVAHRACCLILVVFWTRWLGRRHSPFRNSASTTSPS